MLDQRKLGRRDAGEQRSRRTTSSRKRGATSHLEDAIRKICAVATTVDDIDLLATSSHVEAMLRALFPWPSRAMKTFFPSMNPKPAAVAERYHLGGLIYSWHLVRR